MSNSNSNSNNGSSGSGNNDGITLKDLINKADELNKKIKADNSTHVEKITEYRVNLSNKIANIEKLLEFIDSSIEKLLKDSQQGKVSNQEMQSLKFKLQQTREQLKNKLDELEKTQIEQTNAVRDKIEQKTLVDNVTKLNDYVKGIVDKIPKPPDSSRPDNLRPSRGGRRTTRKFGKKLRRTLTKAKKTLRKLKAKAKKVKKAKKQTYTQKGGYIWPFKQDKGKKGKGKGKNKKTTSKTKRSRLSIF